MMNRQSLRKAVTRLSGIVGPKGPALITELTMGISSWTVPRTSKYTFYCYGAGYFSSGGPFARVTKTLTAGTVLNCHIGWGAVGAGSTGYGPGAATTLSGGGINVSLQYNVAPTGGDFMSTGDGSTSGGDGSLFGPKYGHALYYSGGQQVDFARGPGAPAPSWSSNTWGHAGDGLIRIVDETPA